jgi:hypothetical protein
MRRGGGACSTTLLAVGVGMRIGVGTHGWADSDMFCFEEWIFFKKN